MKRIFIITALIFIGAVYVSAQQNMPSTFQGKHHMLSPDELKIDVSNNKSFTITPPPSGPVRNIAEFERNQGVIVSRSSSWAFGIPNELITELSENVMVYVVVSSSSWNSSVTSQLQNAGANMDNITLINYSLNSYWSRDYSPWFIAYGESPQVGIVDFPYNRPRPSDDDIPVRLGEYFDIEVFGMNITHTGGNYMCDGLGKAASTTLVLSENSTQTQAQLQTLAEDYLGVTDYMFIDDPLGEYIEHIDCWGKFLDVDKVLIGQVPPSDSRYDDYEAVADFFANKNSSYGNKFQVFRVYSPDGQPYTNSLIMNEKVFVPLVPGSEWNDEALEAYELAMPGYEVIGVSYDSWEATDALHCRTHEVPDFGMLYINHIPYTDTVAYFDEYQVKANIFPYSGFELAAGSVKIHYRVNNGAYSTYEMTNTTGSQWQYNLTGLADGDVIDYYLEASDESGRTEKHPLIGEPDPHHFVIDQSLYRENFSNDNDFSVFPNPAADRISLVTNLNMADQVYCTITDINGKSVLSFSMETAAGWQRNVLDISSLSPGLYLMHIESGSNRFSKRFVVY